MLSGTAAVDQTPTTELHMWLEQICNQQFPPIEKVISKVSEVGTSTQLAKTCY